MQSPDEDWIYKAKPTNYGTSGPTDGSDNAANYVNMPPQEPENLQTIHVGGIDRSSLKRTRRRMLVGAVLALVIGLGQIAGGVLSHSRCLVANAAAFLLMFGRLLFLAFILHNAGRPTSRMQLYRRHKPEIILSILALLCAWLIAGASLFDTLVVTSYYGYKLVLNWPSFLIASGVGFLFALVFLVVQALGVYQKVRNQKEGYTRFRVGPPGPVTELIPTYSRERGLLLRKTIKHVPMKPYFFLSIWFFIQCLLAFLAASLYSYYAHSDSVQVKVAVVDAVEKVTGATELPKIIEDNLGVKDSDFYLALAFIPLTIIGSLILVRDMVNLLTEGILQGIDFTEIAQSLLSIDGVTGIRHLRIWALTMDRVSVSVTLGIGLNADVETVLNKASALLKAKYDIFEYNIDTASARDNRQKRREPITHTRRVF